MGDRVGVGTRVAMTTRVTVGVGGKVGAGTSREEGVAGAKTEMVVGEGTVGLDVASKAGSIGGAEVIEAADDDQARYNSPTNREK